MVGYGRSWTMVWYMLGTMVGKCSTPPNEIRQTRSAKRDPAKRGPPNEVRQTRFAQPRQTRSAKRGPPNEVRQTRSAKRDSAKRDSTYSSEDIQQHGSMSPYNSATSWLAAYGSQCSSGTFIGHPCRSGPPQAEALGTRSATENIG